MTGPIDGVLAFHNAFRRDMAGIDNASLESARGKPGYSAAIERFRFFNEILAWHAHGEEIAIFPVLEGVAPSVAEAYERDHRGLDAAFDALDAAVCAHDALRTTRVAAAFRFHLDIHLGKEDAHLYRLFRERVSLPDQAKAVGILSSAIPSQRFPEVIAWLFPLLGIQDREDMARVFEMLMPAPVFAGVKVLIRKAVGDGWDELARRVPSLV